MAEQRTPPQTNEPPETIFHNLDRPSPIMEFFAEIHDFIRPPKKPELVLESTPIPVKELWEKPKSLGSRMGSVGLHVAVIGLVLLGVEFWRPVQKQVQKALTVEIYAPVTTIHPPQTPHFRRLSGGGAPVPTPVPKLIQTPKPAAVDFAPQNLVPITQAMDIPAFGSIGPIAGPPGAGGGSHGGSGGNGEGSAGGTCTGPDCIDAGSIAAISPVLLHKVEPEFTDAARKAKFQGTCIVQVVVGTDGRVHDPKVIQPLGLGLDQKAIDAVLKWRFKPARDRNGNIIATLVNIDVNFRLF